MGTFRDSKARKAFFDIGTGLPTDPTAVALDVGGRPAVIITNGEIAVGIWEPDFDGSKIPRHASYLRHVAKYYDQIRGDRSRAIGSVTRCALILATAAREDPVLLHYSVVDPRYLFKVAAIFPDGLITFSVPDDRRYCSVVEQKDWPRLYSGYVPIVYAESGDCFAMIMSMARDADQFRIESMGWHFTKQVTE